MNNAVYTDYSPIKWSQEHSIEVPELDSQHKELMSFFNEAISRCSEDKTEERIYFDNVKDTFIDVLTRHFGTEERFLFGRNYAQYEEHKLEHVKLLEKINYIKSEIENNRWEMKLFILAITLKDMLMYHLNSYDINAKEYFGKGTGIHQERVQRVEEDYYAFQG